MAGLQALIASPPVPLSRLSSKDAEEGDVEMDTDPLGAATNEQSEDADTTTSKRGGGKRVEGGLMPPATPQPSVISTGVSANCWSVLCDVNATLEAAANTSSPSGYALDARSGSSMSLLVCLCVYLIMYVCVWMHVTRLFFCMYVYLPCSSF